MGRREKRKEIRELVMKFKVEVCCIQETKLEILDARMCRSTWGNSNFDWAYKASEGMSGGMLTIWDSDTFCKRSS